MVANDHVGADFNHDEIVDGNDFLIWQDQFGGPPSGGGSVVPEPTSIALAALAFLGLASVRRRFA